MVMLQRFHKYDRDRIAAAVRAAEAETTGQIVVTLSPWFWGSAEAMADRAFKKLGIARTKDRNGVLIFVCPRKRTAVIRGDEGIHAHAGQQLWDDAVAAIAGAAAIDLTAGIVRAIELVGARLVERFPARGPHENELPDRPV
ncbi:MAG: TPM domain-containing protein [Kofleriaceae bacterium]